MDSAVSGIHKRSRSARQWFGATLLPVGILSCSDKTLPEPWFEAKADTISIAGARLAIVHSDTATDAPDIRLRVTAEVPLDELGFRFGLTRVQGGSCRSLILRDKYYTARSLVSGQTREIARVNRDRSDFEWPSTAPTVIIRNGVKLGNPFAGQYVGTWTWDPTGAEPILAAVSGYITVDGKVRMDIPFLLALAEGTIDARGFFTAFSYPCKIGGFSKLSSPFGEPLITAGSELSGTLIDSIFRPPEDVGTRRFTVRMMR